MVDLFSGETPDGYHPDVTWRGLACVQQCLIDVKTTLVDRQRVTRLAVVLFVCVLASFARPVTAQTLRVHVRDSVSGVPISQALVTIRSDADGTSLNGVTNASGALMIGLPAAGRWSLTVRRIGLRPRSIGAREVLSGAVVDVTVAMQSVQFVLPLTRVVASAGNCVRADASNDRTSALWEQVTLALQATVLFERRRDAASLRVVAFDHELDRSLQLVSETPVQIRRGLGRPFLALHPDSLARSGYVHADSELSLRYFAPDETSLLSESFANTHCFDTPAVDANPALAELRFQPAPSQRVPDIAGTAFVDTASGALRRITFRYVNAGPLFPDGTAHAGGDVWFDQLPNGAWIVTGWSIRMPRMVRVAWARGPRLSGYHEVGAVIDTTTGGASHTVALARDSMPQVMLSGTASAPRNEPETLATGDQVIVNGKRIVGTSGPARRARDWRAEYAARRRASVGVFRDSNEVARSPGGTALTLLQQLGDIRLFVVPDGVPAPPSSDDPDLAEGWSRGAPLPMMSLVDGSRAAGQCHVKLFLDAERTSAAVLHAMPRSGILAMEFFPRPRDVPDGFRRSGNICGTVLLWSTRAGGTAP